MWCKMRDRSVVLHWGWSAKEGAKQLNDDYTQVEACCLNWFVFFLLVTVGLRGQSCSLLYTARNLRRCPPYDALQYHNTDAGCHPNLRAGAPKCVGRVTSEGLRWQIFRWNLMEANAGEPWKKARTWWRQAREGLGADAPPLGWTEAGGVETGGARGHPCFPLLFDSFCTGNRARHLCTGLHQGTPAPILHCCFAAWVNRNSAVFAPYLC